MAKGTFVTVINCMDGRTQLPVNEWMRKNFEVDYVDTITEPGPNGILCSGSGTQISSIKDRVLKSMECHGSRLVALVGHHDCGGNPGPKDMQIEQVEKGLDVIRSWGLPVKLLGLWVGEKWTVEAIDGPESQ
ncbi:MAG: hypothetical protein JXA22_00095 [Candidatus Thermoplasmatota archaeon]|nr:hypothetical protein [Candidatus Thermoplasmatota archaeon]